MKRPKTPEPTAQEKAVVERQSRMLDEEMEESEKRLKALARGKLGSKSLLAKAGGVGGQSGVTRGFTGAGIFGGGSAGSSGLQSGAGYTATNTTTRKAR
jgi:hypothetical protein